VVLHACTCSALQTPITVLIRSAPVLDGSGVNHAARSCRLINPPTETSGEALTLGQQQHDRPKARLALPQRASKRAAPATAITTDAAAAPAPPVTAGAPPDPPLPPLAVVAALVSGHSAVKLAQRTPALKLRQGCRGAHSAVRGPAWPVRALEGRLEYVARHLAATVCVAQAPDEH
jgi:hypothetical protein